MATKLDKIDNYNYLIGNQLIVPTQTSGQMRCECGTTIEVTEIFIEFDEEIKILLRTGCSRMTCPIYKGRTKVTIYKLNEILKINVNEILYEKLVDYKGVGDSIAKKLTETQFDTINKVKKASTDDLQKAGFTEGQAKKILLAVNS